MRYLLASLLSLAVMTALPNSAAAHAYLDHSQPADGAVLATAPTAVKLWFSRAIEPAFSSVRVVDDQGVQVDDGKPTVNDDTPKLIQVGLTAVMAGKKYKVIYRIVALDGHKVKGEFSFSVK